MGNSNEKIKQLILDMLKEHGRMKIGNLLKFGISILRSIQIYILNLFLIVPINIFILWLYQKILM